MSDCQSCDAEPTCYYQYKPCDCVGMRKFKSADDRIADLEYENEQFSIAIEIMQPENARLSKCCTQRGAMLEQIYQRLKVTDSKDPYHFGDWFDDNGVPK